MDAVAKGKLSVFFSFFLNGKLDPDPEFKIEFCCQSISVQFRGGDKSKKAIAKDNSRPATAASENKDEESMSAVSEKQTMERTFVAIKPDGVKRRLMGEIISRFERRGLNLVAMKFVKAERHLLEQHYHDLRSKPFYTILLDYMESGPVVAMAWEGAPVPSEL